MQFCITFLLNVILRSNLLSILKEINPEYSLEGLMLKLQYFDHWLNGHEFEQTPGDSEDREASMLHFVGSQRVRHNLATKQQKQLCYSLLWKHLFCHRWQNGISHCFQDESQILKTATYSEILKISYFAYRRQCDYPQMVQESKET